MEGQTGKGIKVQKGVEDICMERQPAWGMGSWNLGRVRRAFMQNVAWHGVSESEQGEIIL